MCLVCMSGVFLRAKHNTAQHNPKYTSHEQEWERETGGMVLACAERWISELGSLNGAGLGEEY